MDYQTYAKLKEERSYTPAWPFRSVQCLYFVLAILMILQAVLPGEECWVDSDS